MLRSAWLQLRMHKLFDLVSVPCVKGTEELYVRKNGDHLSYDTYFNSLPVKKLKKYTTVTELIFRIRSSVSGTAEIAVLDHSGSSTAAKFAVSDEVTEIRIGMNDIPENAVLLYPVFYGCVPEDVSVWAEGEYSDIKPVLIMCTYRRRVQAEANVRYLSEKMSRISGDIILVDNASEIPEDHFSDSRVTVIHNENTGGSGGFGRGMKEAAQRKGYTHIILMDDDVTVDFAAFEKLTGFLAFLKEDHSSLCISGSMIFSDDPVRQFEAGGFFSETGLQEGYGYRSDLRSVKDILKNEEEKNINYGGWWFMCFPAKYVYEGNFPVPFFLKYDDVEYSLRCRMDIITLNGVGVWHENFGSKYNSVQEYFNTRNYLHLMKMHTDGFDKKAEFRTALRLLTEKLCRHQYKMASAVILGYRDYLKGEEFLKKVDTESKLHELSELNYEMLDDEEISAQGAVFDKDLYRKCSSAVFRRYMQPLLYGYLIPPFLCRKLVITDVLSDRKEHYFRAYKVLHYCTDTGKGYMTRRSFIKFIYMIIKLFNVKMKYSEGRK